MSVATPEAFGFLDNSKPGNLIINDNQLSVPNGRDFTIVGGDVQIEKSVLSTSGGNIQIASVASVGEVTRADVMNNTLSQQGNIVINSAVMSAVMNVENQALQQRGAITIHGGQVFLNNSLVRALGDMHTGDLKIASKGELQINSSQLQTETLRGQAGNLIFTAQQMLVNNNGIIQSISPSTGTIAINTNESLEVNNGFINTITLGGQAGTINVQTDASVKISGNETLFVNIPTVGGLQFINGLQTITMGDGNGGDITVATPELLIMGNGGIAAETIIGTGNAGNIALDVNKLIFEEGGRVNASSAGAGNGGDITVIVDDSAEIVGQSAPLPDGEIQPSAIGSSAFGSGNGGTIRMTVKNALKLDERGTIQTLTRGDGKAGDIFINVKDLTIAQGGDIDASNEGSGHGKGGNITINASGTVQMTAEQITVEQGEFKPIVKDGYFGGVYSVARNAGTGGNVELSAERLILREGGVISVGSIGLGNAGNLTMSIDDTLTMDNAEIITHATYAGGGNIHIETPTNLHLTNNSTITAQAQGIKSTDKGGNIAVKSQAIFTLDNSQLLANAYAGNGGNIDIKTNQFNVLGNSQIDVSSQLGLNGEFILNSVKLKDDFLTLPPPKFQNIELSLSRCAGLSRKDLSSFSVIIKDVPPAAPGDLKTHFYIPEDESE